MKRRLFTILSALSLLLFVAVVVLWVRSHWFTDGVGYVWVSEDRLVRTFFHVDSSEGQLSLTHWVKDYSVTERARSVATREVLDTGFIYLAGDASDEGMRGWGFEAWHRRQITMFDTASKIGIGHWALALLFWLAPAIWMRDFAKRRARGRAGSCPSCGYDLHATPGRCPECGLVPAAPPTTPLRGNVR